MAPPHLSSTLSVLTQREPTSPETEVRTRVLAWCSAWSSIDGKLPTEKLREIVTDGPVRMATDFGGHMTVNVSLGSYCAFWSSLVSETFCEWSLMIDSPIDVTISGDMAVAEFHTRLQGMTHENDRKSQRQHSRQMFEYARGVWRLVQEQTTIVHEEACL
jgi:hypothetical protein